MKTNLQSAQAVNTQRSVGLLLPLVRYKSNQFPLCLYFGVFSYEKM